MSWHCSTMLLAVVMVARSTEALHAGEAPGDLDGILELDASLAPSAAEIRAAAKTWSERMAATPAEEFHTKLRERRLSSQGATGSRRNLQQLSSGPLSDSGIWAFDSSEVRSIDQSELQPLEVAGGCQDVLASNFGADEYCLYDCTALQAHYFPQLPAGAPFTCFVYDPNTRAWPNELTDMRRDKLIWHTFLPPTELSPTGQVSFAVGSDLACVNVTVQTEQITATGATTEEEIRCVLPGFHEHNHTVENNHTVTVVGYVQSDLHSGAGGTTEFVVGECTDTYIRVHTSSGAHDITWELDDDGHNGPWQFTSEGGAALHEYKSCMFDNNFTLTKLSTDAWLGTIEVVSYVPDKTIDIPIDQTWIVQGAVVDGVPVRLDARLKSGDAYVEGGEKGVLSEANLVVRHVRFTNQSATLDKFAQYRQHSMAAVDVSLGAAVEYVGGWGATLIFEGCVFDHMLATSGGAMYIHGQVDEWARDDTRKNRPQDHTLTIVISDCLFWELTALWVGGAARIVDVYPLNLTVTNSQFLDSVALVSSAINWALYGIPFDPEQPDNPRYGLAGTSSVSFSRTEVAGSRPPLGFGMAPIMFITFPGHWAMGPGTERPDVQTSINVEELYCHDNAVSIVSCIALETKASCGGSCFNYTLSDSDIRDGLGTALWAKDAGAASYFQAESHQVVRVKFNANGNGDATETAVSEGSALYIHARVWARLVNISAVGNVASRGGAARLFGEGTFELIGCLFQSNVAWESGGAIYKTGIGPLFIHDSSFTMNNVTRQIQVETDIVVLVFTGSYGSTGFHTPIWKLDGVVPSALNGSCADDLIHGYSLDGDRTHEYSTNSMYAEVVSTTSGPHTLWHGVVVHSGVQTRTWEGGGYIDIVGILPKFTPAVCDSRLRADCQCSDPAGNLMPCVVRAPGCQTGYNADTTGDQDNEGSGDVKMCPMHSLENPQMIWSKTEFNVPQGQGGALAVSGTSTVEITETTFSSNYAGFGETISATSVESLKVLGTDFSNVDSNTIFTEAVPAYECSNFPCSPGERCTVAQLSLHCNACSPGQISQDGIDCQTCVPGKEPNAIRTLCVACAEGRYSSGATGGICDLCQIGKTSAEDRQTCIECPAGTRGAELTCEPCDPGHFSNEGGALFCNECEAGKISSEDRITCVACPEGTTRQLGDPACSVCGAGHHPNEDGRCVPCSEDGHFSLGGIGSTCTACENGKQPLQNRTGCKDCPGGTAGTDGVCTLCQPGRHASSGEIACSLCPAGMEPTLDRSACQCKIGTYDSNSIGLISCDGLANPEPSRNEECTACPPCLDCTSRGTVWLNEGWASHGSEGTVFLCPYRSACPAHRLNGSTGGTLSNQGCATGYDPAAPLCAMCAAEYNAYKVGMVCDPCDDGTINVPMLVGFVAVALTAVALVLSGFYEWLLDNGMLTDLRIMIGLYQILGQADAVLRIDFPSPVPELMSVAKLIFLDIRTLLRMDCFELGGFYAKLVTNLCFLPMLAAFACYVYYLSEKKTVDRMVAEGVTDSGGLRSASLNLQRNLMVGVFVMYPMMTTTLFSIPMCRELGDSRYHESDYWVSCDSSSFSLVMVLAVFGVLAVPLGLPLLFFLRMRRKVQDLGGQPNENAAGGAKLAANDAEDQSDQFAFLVQSYSPSHWYWETVSYMRKLCLNGWTVVVGRGTMGQIYFATLTSALFLLWHMRAWPFIVHKHNVMEATCEATLLLMYTTCLLLRNTDDDIWSNEWVSRSGYGWMLVGLFVIVCPSPMFYSLWLHANDKNQGDSEVAFTNPLGDGGGINETPQGAEQRVRNANIQRRKSKSLAQELSKTQVQLSKAQAQLAVLKPQAESGARVAYSLDVRRPSQVSALEELAGSGMVEQETLQKAQQGFSKHVRDQIEDMEAVSTSRDSLRAFLNRPDVRLGHHAQAFIDIGGEAMTAEDLQFLNEEDVAQVSLPMSKIESRRLKIALESVGAETATAETEERSK